MSSDEAKACRGSVSYRHSIYRLETEQACDFVERNGAGSNDIIDHPVNLNYALYLRRRPISINVFSWPFNLDDFDSVLIIESNIFQVVILSDA